MHLNFLAIPRPSGKEEKIADYLCQFAKENGLWCSRDCYNNVIIKKDNGGDRTIILQAHTDMVCVAADGIEKDFEKEGIDWFIDGDFYRAKGTSLGADDGIGVALILAVLSSNQNGLPNIEAVLTSQEETTMLGASKLCYAQLTGKHIIGLDGVREGVLEVSSAGMCDITLEKKLNANTLQQGKMYQLKVEGLLGGHSGGDIDKGRVNGITLLANILNECDVASVASLVGGNKINVIPSSAECSFSSNKKVEELQAVCLKYTHQAAKKGEHPIITLEDVDLSWESYDAKDVLNFITSFKQGVVYSMEGGFPITSQNMGVAQLENGKIKILLSVRSSDKEKEARAIEAIEKLATENGFSFSLGNCVPFFSYKENSLVREVLGEAYTQLFGKKVATHHVHAGLEGGVFAQKIPDLDICVMAPDLYDIHSTNERVSISSIVRTQKWLIRALSLFEQSI